MGFEEGQGRRLSLAAILAAASVLCGVLGSETALAQSASSSLSSYSRGYSGSASTFEAPVDVATRDADGNLTIVNGVMQAPAGSVFSNLSSLGASSTSTGAGSTAATGSTGSGSAVAIGNNLNVVVSGDNNTVVVNSTQTNTGAVSASTVLNGKVNLDGGQ